MLTGSTTAVSIIIATFSSCHRCPFFIAIISIILIVIIVILVQASAMMNYEGLDFNASMAMTVYKPNYPANHSTSVTLSGRLQSWLDADGTASRRPGRPTVRYAAGVLSL